MFVALDSSDATGRMVVNVHPNQAAYSAGAPPVSQISIALGQTLVAANLAASPPVAAVTAPQLSDLMTDPTFASRRTPRLPGSYKRSPHFIRSSLPLRRCRSTNVRESLRNDPIRTGTARFCRCRSRDILLKRALTCSGWKGSKASFLMSTWMRPTQNPTCRSSSCPTLALALTSRKRGDGQCSRTRNSPSLPATTGRRIFSAKSRTPAWRPNFATKLVYSQGSDDSHTPGMFFGPKKVPDTRINSSPVWHWYFQYRFQQRSKLRCKLSVSV